jgi:excisionase family DNA binding protein
MEIEEKVWTTQEAAARLKCCVGTIYRMIERKEIKAIGGGKKGAKIRISESEIKKFIAGVEK